MIFLALSAALLGLVGVAAVAAIAAECLEAAQRWSEEERGAGGKITPEGVTPGGEL